MQVTLLPTGLQLQLRLDVVRHDKLQDSSEVKRRQIPSLFDQIYRDSSLSNTCCAHEAPHSTRYLSLTEI